MYYLRLFGPIWGAKKNDGATRLSIKYLSTQVRRLLSHSEIPIAWPEQYSSEAHSLTGFLVLELGRLDSLSRDTIRSPCTRETEISKSFLRMGLDSRK